MEWPQWQQLWLLVLYSWSLVTVVLSPAAAAAVGILHYSRRYSIPGQKQALLLTHLLPRRHLGPNSALRLRKLILGTQPILAEIPGRFN